MTQHPSQSAAPPAAMGLFERYLSAWVGLCIFAGIGLGHLAPSLFSAIAAAEVARVNLVVAVLVWLMIVPMLRSEERRVGKECVVRVDLGGRRIIKKKNSKKL